MTGTPAKSYTTAEVAEMLQMSEEWLRKRVRHRTVPHVRLGRRVRFSAASITAIIEAGEQTGRAQGRPGAHQVEDDVERARHTSRLTGGGRPAAI